MIEIYIWLYLDKFSILFEKCKKILDIDIRKKITDSLNDLRCNFDFYIYDGSLTDDIFESFINI